MLAWKAQVHRLNELLSYQSADSLVTFQLIHFCPAAGTLVVIVFVCAYRADEVTILALCDMPISGNMETNDALEGLLNLPLVLGLCFPDSFVAGFFADPFYL